MLKFQNKRIVSLQDWDELVQQTYGKPYHFQQQNGCHSRGTYYLTVPARCDDYPNNTLENKKDGEETEMDMGVSFAGWLARDPKEKLNNQEHDFELRFFWTRRFYPDIQMIANDLHAKGLMLEGEYVIDIDW